MELWTKEHAITFIPAFIVMIIIGIVLHFTIGKKSEKIRMIPFQVVAVILVILELIKQIHQLVNGYDLYTLPFHFCSLFIFFPVITAFYNGKFKEQIRSFTTTALAMLTLFMVIYPNLVYSATNINEIFSNFMNFHTVVFHNLAVFEFVLVIALKLHTPNAKRDFKALFIGFSIFCVISATMAQILKTNFNNFYYCGVAPIESLRLSLQGSLGYGLSQTLYVLCVCIADILFALLSYGLYRLCLFIYNKIKSCFKPKQSELDKKDQSQTKETNADSLQDANQE